MTSKQSAFAREFTLDMNATQAAVRAGYSPRTANREGTRLLVLPAVKAEVDRLVAERAGRVDVSADDVIRDLAAIAFGDVRRLYRDDGTLKPMAELTAEEAVMIASVEVVEEKGGTVRKVRLRDKIRAPELLGKHLGMFADRHKHEVTGKEGGAIEHDHRFTLTAEDLAAAERLVAEVVT